ncbi:thioredoxin TrxA [Anaerophilus nitritogenes]|uniref:thioredoxin TrxA n=1 Tax=Anaerophilus nitritogenes TaxID=2498136 RepID=UPI00101E1A7F|nr:thioredoxin domain-containing protein [Anaerophilus nitritogenes]
MISVDNENFQKQVLDIKTYVIVDYWHEACAPCRVLMPDVEELEKKYETKIQFIKVNTAKARRLAISQKILGLPTIALYQNGEKIDEVIKDEATKKNIEKMIQKYVE